MKNFDLLLNRAEDINIQNLYSILDRNKNTEYGRKYNFSSISTYEQYCKEVPITDYSAYKQYEGRQELITDYSISYKLYTSGTMGRQKQFALTDESLERYSNYIYQMPYSLIGEKAKNNIHISAFHTPNESGTILSCAYYRYLLDSGKLQVEDFVGGEKFLFTDDMDNVPYVKLWLALTCEELNAIQSIFLYDTLLVLRYLEDNYKIILQDMKAGSISVPLSDRMKSELLKLKGISDDRLMKLEDEFSKGFDTPIVPRIWKNIKFISGIGGNHHMNYMDLLKRYIGDVPVYYFAYASSEVMAGVATEFGKEEYTILPDSAFYEFLPLESDNDTVIYDKIKVGEKYELVVTTFSGLYRYKTGDVVKVIGFNGQAPRFEVLGRRENLVNIAGEKIDIKTIKEVIHRFTEELDIVVEEFSIGYDKEEIPCRYVCFVELKEKSTISEEATIVFDRIIKELSVDYKEVRELGMIGMPKICLVPRFSHRECNEQTVGMAHNKPKIILNNKQYSFMLERSEGYGEEF